MCFPLPRLIIFTLAILAWCHLDLGEAAPALQSKDDKPPIRYCVDNPAWAQWLRELAPDCESAIEILRENNAKYLKAQGNFRFFPDHSYVEFPSLSESMPLPQVVEHQNCAVAIVMMHTFTNKDTQIQFPGITDPFMPGRWSRTDTALFGTLISEADEIRATCGNGMGYSLVGGLRSIGVATMATDSRWAKFIKSKVPPRLAANATSIEYTPDSQIATS